ncbi:hypothetical protein C5E05_19450 [Pseudoclavibacter sp. AY1H1]|nr:hypothetical protein C5E05_19450 [Pseudoclavibacter sp. AY1H1]
MLDRYARAALPTKLRHSYEDAYFRALTSRLLRVEDLEMRDQGLLESEIRDTFEDALPTPLGIRFTVLCGSDSTCTVTVHVRDRSPSTQLDSIDAIRSTSTKFRGRANLVVTFADDLQHTSDS